MHPLRTARSTFVRGAILLVLISLLGWACYGLSSPFTWADEPDHPFKSQGPAPSLEGGIEWINTAGPIDLKQLRGKFVVLDFWTNCCVNCMHVLPELKKLEKAYPNELVVVGVHSGKFFAEHEGDNITSAVLRNEIEHPVVNDANYLIWNRYGVRSWPSLCVIDPEGNVIWTKSGEIRFETFDAVIKQALPIYRRKGVLDTTPLRFELAAWREKPMPLRFPGKITADEKSNRLFISDTNHNRIVIADLEGKLLDVIGSGDPGGANGAYTRASFAHPQGTALTGDYLYVADTGNHLIRRVNLRRKVVETVAGTGKQGSRWPGMEEFTNGLGTFNAPFRFVGVPIKTALNSPWALAIEGSNLYIAMAGPHEIWKMTLQPAEIGPFAGNGREDIIDGRHLPFQQYELGSSSFAQPSGLSTDGNMLFVADSEGSSIRAVPLDPAQPVRTVAGAAWAPDGVRLFTFGDVDGAGQTVRLQHPLDVLYHDGQLYVADTFNSKIKVVDPTRGSVRTLAGTGKHGSQDDPAEFDEPEGLAYAKGKLYVADTNNHLIRTIDLATKKVATLEIQGLSLPEPPKVATKPVFPGAATVELGQTNVRPIDGKVRLQVALELPAGYKLNAEAPLSYYVEGESASGPIEREALAKLTEVTQKSPTFEIALPAAGSGKDKLKVSLSFFYCQTGSEGVCKTGNVIWTVPLNVAAEAETNQVRLLHKVRG